MVRGRDLEPRAALQREEHSRCLHEGLQLRKMAERQYEFFLRRVIKFKFTFEVMKRFLLDDCVTPDNKRGQCIPILACPVLYKAFANPRKDLENYWSKFICVSKSNFGEFQVCCPNATTDVRADDDVMGVAGNLSNKQFCGYQHRDDYISEDSSIAIDEFPWVAIIRAIDPSTLKETSLCSGSLINRGYILTSAYCVTNWKNSQM